MTAQDVTTILKTMKVRSNNVHQFGAYTVEKWGTGRFKIMHGNAYIGVSDERWVIAKLTLLGVITSA